MQQDVESKREKISLKNIEYLHLQAANKLNEEALEKSKLETELLQKTLEEQIKNSEDTRLMLQEQINRIQNELQNIRNSIFWKTTAPLRRVMDIFRRG